MQGWYSLLAQLADCTISLLKRTIHVQKCTVPSSPCVVSLLTRTHTYIYFFWTNLYAKNLYLGSLSHLFEHWDVHDWPAFGTLRQTTLEFEARANTFAPVNEANNIVSPRIRAMIFWIEPKADHIGFRKNGKIPTLYSTGEAFCENPATIVSVRQWTF